MRINVKDYIDGATEVVEQIQAAGSTGKGTSFVPHVGQAVAALEQVHESQDGRCAWCGLRAHPQRGILGAFLNAKRLQAADTGPEWACAICATVHGSQFLPPPPGWFLRRLPVPSESARAGRLQAQMSEFGLPWAVSAQIELGNLPVPGLASRVVLVPSAVWPKEVRDPSTLPAYSGSAIQRHWTTWLADAGLPLSSAHPGDSLYRLAQGVDEATKKGIDLREKLAQVGHAYQTLFCSALIDPEGLDDVVSLALIEAPVDHWFSMLFSSIEG